MPVLRFNKNKVLGGCLRREKARRFAIASACQSAARLREMKLLFAECSIESGCGKHLVRLVGFVGMFVFLMATAAHAEDKTWKDHVVFDKGNLSVEVSGVLVGELIQDIGLKADAKVSVDDALAKRRITVNFSGVTIEEGMTRIGAALGLPDLAMFYKPGKGPGSNKGWVVSTIKLMKSPKGKSSTPNTAAVKDIPSLIYFINQVGSQDADCEQTYFALSSLGLGTKAWWKTAGKLQELMETAQNPWLSTCVRMASLELYISKLSKEELQKILPDLQSYFGAASVPDKLVARLTQLLAERDVAPTQLIATILESDARGQAARSHAWYAAGRTQTYTPHLLNLAMQDANSAGTTQSVSGKMALEYMSNMPQSSVAAEDESKVNVSVVQAVNRAIELPNDTGLNELGRSMAAVSAIPRFLPKAEVVPFLDQVIVKAANDDVKLTALDVLLTIQTDYASEVAAQAKKVTDNLETIFMDAVSRERAKARLNMLVHK